MLSVALAVLSAVVLGSVAVEDESEGCLNRLDVSGRLQAVLLRAKRFGPRELVVSATARPPEDEGHQAAVWLKAAERGGDVLIDRRFDLRREDCKSAGALLETVLTQTLKELPDAINEEPSPAASVELGLGIDSAFSPANGGLALVASGDVGTARNRLLGTLVVRVVLPESIGPGRFYEATVMAGVGFRHAFRSLRIAVEARGGVVVLSGAGFDRSETTYLPWIEGALTVLWAVGPIEIGPTVSGSPLVEDVLVLGQPEAGRVAQLRAGLLLALPIARWEI